MWKPDWRQGRTATNNSNVVWYADLKIEKGVNVFFGTHFVDDICLATPTGNNVQFQNSVMLRKQDVVDKMSHQLVNND